MNPVLMLTRNNLELTKRAIKSASGQSLPVVVHIIDNGSTDGTRDAGLSLGHTFLHWYEDNRGVSKGWNTGLDILFAFTCDHILVINNDVVIPPWFYLELLSYDVPFVSGIAVDDMALIQEPAVRMPLSPNPDFSAFLIRRDCWEKVGPFDERMKLYASDCDFHVRAHKLGVPLYKAHVPYYHERSSTLNNASPEERQEIERQANEDRAVFRKLYGCLPGTPEYSALFE